jgi:hypothetical protein
MTMFKVSFVLLVAATSLSAQAAPTVARSVPAAELAELEKIRKDVWVNWFAGDTAALHRVLAPELVAISPDGRESLRQTLDGSAAFKKGGGRLLSISFDSNVVHRFGDVVVMFSRYSLVTENAGKRAPRSGQVTEVFTRHNGRWVHTAWHLDAYGGP